MQVARAGVVAQAGPQGHHVIRWRLGQRGEGGAACEEAGVVGDDRVHLGLLQHDLRQPDAVGVGGVLPGQVVAATVGVPGNQSVGEVAHRWGVG